MRVTCCTHIILPDFMSLILRCEEHTLWSSLLRYFIRAPVTPIHLGPDIITTLLISIILQ